MHKTGIGLLAVLLLAGCGGSGMTGTSPPLIVLPLEQPYDHRLTCTQLEQEIRGAEETEQQARALRSEGWGNVASSFFSLPEAVGGVVDAQEAIGAAQRRRAYLMDLFYGKGCTRPDTG